MLQIKNLKVSVENKQILNGLNFEFETGKIYAIMGPNGSGKSTLAQSIMGSPVYEIDKDSKIFFNNKNITELEPNERAMEGIFLSFQAPLSLSGVKVFQLLQLALNGKKEPLKIREEIKKYKEELGINQELLSRSLNEGASGGERKKIEVLQAVVLDKDFLIFDEVDTGVDVDSLKSISKFLKKYKKNKTIILITHYNRILHYLKPDYVLVMKNGQIVKVGDHKVAKEIESDGYKSII